MTFKMFSDDALKKFAVFCDAANANHHTPAGAFDAMPKTSTRKESNMSKFRYVPLKGCGNILFTRERSTNMAFDAAGRDPNEIPHQILEFLGGKISESDLAQVKELLMIEAGEKPDVVKEAEKMADASAS